MAEELIEDVEEQDNRDTQKDRYLTFRLGDEDYGIEIRHVIEIVGTQKVTQLPESPSFVKGVINLRGQVIPVIDVRARFNMELREYDDRTCVIVVCVEHSQVGLIVDTVSEVREILAADIAPPPSVSDRQSNGFLLGLGKTGDEVKILLDVAKLLFGPDSESIASLVTPTAKLDNE